jgi:hypothetical protein
MWQRIVTPDAMRRTDLHMSILELPPGTAGGNLDAAAIDENDRQGWPMAAGVS